MKLKYLCVYKLITNHNFSCWTWFLGFPYDFIVWNATFWWASNGLGNLCTGLLFVSWKEYFSFYLQILINFFKFSFFHFFRSEVQKIPVKGQFSNLPLFIFLASFAILFTALYLLWPQPVFQHVSYGVLVLTSYALEIRLLRIKGCQICKKLFILSTTIYLFGFLLWNIDNLFCSNLRY